MSDTWKGVIFGIVGTLFVMAIIGLFVVSSGIYNIAATERHSAVVEWALDTAFQNSVRARSDAIVAPTFDSSMITAGAEGYKKMCAHCHGSVGADRAGWATGMRPKPPALAGAADEWSPGELFWLVKNGAKMTGMPAFGETHDDQTIWNIVAFVERMPDMSAEEYAAH